MAWIALAEGTPIRLKPLALTVYWYRFGSLSRQESGDVPCLSVYGHVGISAASP
jgi:hypothetical protein